MITIQQISPTKLSMRCHYAYRERCRDIPGAEFDFSRKAWVAPLDSLPCIQAEFFGEIFYKTPLWKLRGEPEPEKRPIEFQGPVPEVPALALRPYGYQEDGIRFLIDRLNNTGFAMNGDGVGLGKTIQAIGAMKWFVEHRGARKILIVCKKSIKTQWASEIRRIAGWQNAPIFITGSTRKKRLAAYKGIQEARNGILITNYHNFLHDSDEINKVNYDICVIDEAHCVKGRGTKMNALIGETVRGKRTILLTGTPIMSRPDDIWGIVNMVSPEYFGKYEEFRDRYIVTEFGIYGEQIIGAQHLDELQEKIQQFIIMRSADDVALELPKVRPSRKIYCEMDQTQMKMHELVRERKEKLDEKKKEKLAPYIGPDGKIGPVPADIRGYINKLNEFGKMYIASLQFIADDPAVFRYMSPERGMNRTLQEMLPVSYKCSSKTEALVDIVSEIVDADEKVIVFCHLASAARMLKDHFDRIEGANTVMYTGSESDEKRDENIEAFRNDPDCRVIIGTEAMAEGLNLQVSRYVIHYEQADTFAQREQRIGRARRIGSAFTHVNVIDLVTKGTSETGPSHDEIKMRKLAQDKRTSDAMLCRPA